MTHWLLLLLPINTSDSSVKLLSAREQKLRHRLLLDIKDHTHLQNKTHTAYLLISVYSVPHGNLLVAPNDQLQYSCHAATCRAKLASQLASVKLQLFLRKFCRNSC